MPALRSLRATFRLLSIVPMPGGWTESERPSAVWFPIVGALLALPSAGVLLLGGSGSLLATVVAVVLLILLTGGLHMDGLADCADALGARGTGEERRQRRLEIMRDPRTGAYGVLAIVSGVLLQVAALADLARDDPEAAAALFVLVAGLSRAAAAVHAAWVAPAREEGLGAGFAVTAAQAAAAVALAAAGTLAAALLTPAGVRAVFAAVAAGAVLAVWSVLARRRFGGRTGDTLGATVVLCEAVALALAAT